MANYAHPKVGTDGWSEWIQPIPRGYRMSCCDCGLVHELEFRTGPGRRHGRRVIIVQFRAMRHVRATAAVRRERRKAKRSK